jgi:hypothetical protein
VTLAPTQTDLQRAWLRHYDADPLFRYTEGQAGEAGGMSPDQERFHADPARFRYLRAPNQVGKTRAGAAEAWMHALGRHPFRVCAPETGWIVMPDLDNDWPKISEKLREIEPPGALHPGCKYDPAKGYTYGGARRVMCANGKLMLPKSGTQQVLALAGGTIGWLWIDEPPKESHWGEALSRVAVKGGDAWLTFTPIGRPVGWLRTFLEGNPETNDPGHPEWSETVATLTPESCPHRSPESIAAQIASYSAWERAQRVDGAWEGVTKDRYLSGFAEGCVVDPETLPRMERLAIGMDHGEGVGKEYAVIVGWDGFRLWALAEYSAAGNTTPAVDALGIDTALRSLGASLGMVGLAKGDINSSGKLGGGASVNEVMEREFARIAKLARPPFRIETPAKGKGSVDTGVKAINNAFISGRAFILPTCPRLIHACRHWRGGKELKDPVDAYRYIAAEFLIDRPSRGVGRLVMA